MPGASLFENIARKVYKFAKTKFEKSCEMAKARGLTQFVILLGCNSRLQIYSVFFIGLLILVNKAVMNPEANCNGYFLPCVLLPIASNEVFSALCLITTQCGNENQS